jgi:DNA-binding NarL/FixJ family response regulator
MDPEVVTVLVADDSDAFRAGMVRAVLAHAELSLIGEVDGGAAAVEAIAAMRPDVALIDVRMPGIDGLAVCEQLRQLQPPPHTRVVLLSAHLDDVVVARANEVGAHAYMSKAISRREICSEAVRVARSA